MKIILPFRSEFGIKCAYHIPSVHAIEGPKVVCCEPGEAPLYPSADDIIEVERNEDSARRDSYDRDRKFVDDIKIKLSLDTRFCGKDFEFVETDQSMPREYFIPTTKYDDEKMLVGDYDVTICPRFRDYGPNKNLPYWGAIASLLMDAGLSVCAVGAPDSSRIGDVPCLNVTMPAQDTAAWCIATMKRSKLVIATDAGLAFLALLCGKPLVLITHEGRSAPGPVLLGDSSIAKDEYPLIREDRYNMTNHQGKMIVYLDAWNRPKLVADAAIETLKAIK